MNRADVEEALARTVLLVSCDIFPALSDEQIVDGLIAMRVRIFSDRENLGCAAAQTAVVALAIAVAQTGAAVNLCFPDLPQRGAQPPLAARAGLRTALLNHLRHLPVSPLRQADAQDKVVDVVFGDVRPDAPMAPHALRVTGNSWNAKVVRGEQAMSRWRGQLPFGGMLAAVAIAAEVFRAAMRHLAKMHDIPPMPEHALTAADAIGLGLPPVSVTRIPPGETTDIISAGAITNAALFGLWRIPTLHGDVRVFDDDAAALSNCNRYPLLTVGQLGEYKVDALAVVAAPGWSVEPVRRRFDGAPDMSDVALGRHVLVGADDIPTRWRTQERAPDWLCVAATSHFEVVVSEHVVGAACAGCMHPRDESFEGEIPTVAFVSMLAGVLQCHRLLARMAGDARSAPVVAWALALDQPHGIHALAQSPRRDCPVRCAASAAAGHA